LAKPCAEDAKTRVFRRKRCNACGTDHRSIDGIERDEHNLALVNIIKIVRALDVLPSEFFLDLDEVKKTETGSIVKTRTNK
jgi:hypothetical protein